MERIEVIVRITKDHCPPQEQKLFEWDERAQEPAGTLSYPGLEINLEQRRVFKNGQEVCMSRYEYGESCLTAVTNTIGRIRQKIEDDRSAPVYIRTISNLGYQFMPNVLVEKDSL